MNDYLEKIYAADAVILGSPTYFADVPPELKTPIDRAGFVAPANGGMLRGKIGAAVVAVRRGGATHVFDTINHMFLLSSMILPGSIYWNLGAGRDKGEVLGDDEAMRNMSHLGHTIAWLGKAIASVPDAFPIPPYPGVHAIRRSQSRSSFHQHFKANTLMPPLQFQKALRLQEARRLMFSTMTDAGTACWKVGYRSASQFSGEYSRFFEDSPTRDIARLRQLSIMELTHFASSAAH
jgi:hypothetical protein